MSEFEKKFGKYAVQNLSLLLIACYAVGYVIEFINPDFLLYLTLNPVLILRGQIWRIFTWLVVPPPESNIFFTLIMLFFYYSIGTSLERTWGAYRYNVYIFSGMLFTVLGSFVLLGYVYLIYGMDAIWGVVFAQLCGAFSTYYINMSIFLAFAATFPDVQILLMMIIPIKVKWMGIIYGIMLAYEFLTSPFYLRIAMAASLLNFVVFFFFGRTKVRLTPKQMVRRAQFKREVSRSNSGGVTRHKCAICGRTELDNPDLEFRFCGKCNGNYEYCQDHLFTHKHKE